jgi:hypothetical protein
MCRLSSICLIKRLKGSMSGDERVFINIETRAIIKFFFSARQGAERNSRHSKRNTGELAPSYAIVKKCVAQFKRGDFSTCDEPRPRRPKTVNTPEVIDKIHYPILEHRRISTKSIAKQLRISRERVGSIIHEHFDMRKLAAKCVPKCLNADQRCLYREGECRMQVIYWPLSMASLSTSPSSQELSPEPDESI